MTEAYPSNYWLSPTALYITLNALGEPNYIQANCTNGTQILVYVKGFNGVVGQYDNGHNYRRWNLTASPTLFGDSLQKYVYVAIPRDANDNQAFVCYPSEHIDLYGCNESGTQIGETTYYYIWLQGIISAPNANNVREWESTPIFNTGTLSSDEAINAGSQSVWYEYSSVSEIVTILKDMTFATGKRILSAIVNSLSIGTELVFGSKRVTAIATSDDISSTSAEQIATPEFVSVFGNKHYLRKDIADTAAAHITFAAGATIEDNLDFGTFNTGVSGGRISSSGAGELGSLVLRESLTVPKLVYNRTEVMAGNTWRTPGGGEIERVVPNGTVTGIAYLHLEEGEVGMVAVGDICQGVYHLSSGNDSETIDDHKGNFYFAGFKTIYFEVISVTGNYNESFQFRLRAATDSSWNDATFPQAHMNFAVYGNRSQSARQFSALDTTKYHLLLAGVNNWTYGSENIMYIEGLLTGFNIDYQDPDDPSVTKTKSLSGYGIAFGNSYMWGNIDQFSRKPSLISQQIYYLATDKSSGVTTGDTGWTTDPQRATAEKPYLWQYYLQTFSDSTTAVQGPFIASNYAADGTGIEIKGTAISYFDSYSQMIASVTTDGLYLCAVNASGTRSAWLCTLASSSWSLTSASVGDTYVCEDGHLYVAKSNGWTDAGNIKGATGDKGDDAVRRFIMVTPDQITLSADNVYSTSSITAKAYQQSGEGSPALTSAYYIQTTMTSTAGKETISIVQSSSKTIQTASLAKVVFALYNGNPLSGGNLLDSKTVVVIKDGATGSTGARGAMIRPCGEWSDTATYVNNSSFVDVVIYNNNYYSVKSGVSQTTVGTFDASEWDAANNMRFVATKLLLAQKGYIENLLLNYAEAQDADGNTTVSIDGETGQLTAHNAILEGSVRASAYYSDVLSLVASVTTDAHSCDPSVDKVSCYKLSFLSSYTGIFTYILPVNNDYEGMEMDFFIVSEQTLGKRVLLVDSRGASGVIYSPTTFTENGHRVIDMGAGYSFGDQFYIPANTLVTMKYMDGSWYCVRGALIQS